MGAITRSLLIKQTRSSLSSSTQQVLKPFNTIPGPRPLPLIGNIWRYLPLIGSYKPDQLYENAQYNRKLYGPIVREQITSDHTILHLFRPHDVEDLFRHDGKAPHRRSHRALLKYRSERPSVYNDGGLYPENGANWLRLRKLFQHHLMSKSEISKRAPILDEIALDAINKLSEQTTVEKFQEFLNDWSIRGSLAVFLDFRIDEMPDQETMKKLIDCLHHELEAIDGTEIKSQRWVTKPNKCPFFRKLSQSEQTLQAFVTERVDHLLATNSLRPTTSFVHDWLVRDKLDRQDVVTFILDCILAGLHTTTYTTTFLLKHISNWHKDRQSELRHEILACMPPTSEGLRADPSDSMPMLKDCLRETLRLKPVSIGTGRQTQDEMVIGNYVVPRGVMVIAHNQAIGMDACFYEQPEVYRPERWAEYRKRPRGERPSAFAWLPFGFGPRICIGQRLVTMQIHIFAARLLQQYEWQFLSDINTKALIVHTLDGDIKVRLTRLQPA